ncbi:uncharacterized protein LOC124926301 [Impatiens glandulifera]|uniref:uncharacterized protein LOC124926301 n=1 Tax=Impatiens glandulifera TaxID=253017 RepID=UPI001FB08CE3|nr:uncharacterized protein LOC124926301 [Impatiens glandulifera]
MANSKREWTDDDRDDVQEDAEEETSLDDYRIASSSRFGLTERLEDILVEEGDGDLLLQRNDREENVLQYLLALDLQVVGACRADERLNPLLKLHVSGGASEDCLLSHLSRHFEPSEVGMLARCLCIPLVSIRVGKINKQGALLCPTETRGNLDLTLLPTSDLRITFVGDDGKTEILTTIKRAYPFAASSVEKISSDNSGRSFLIKKMIPKGEVSYFWCSEKSKVIGDELLNEMKDLMEKKPSLAELTGICESRLDLFAAHIRAYAVESTALNSNPETTLHDEDVGPSYHPAQSRKQHIYLHQGSLGPRSSSFKECQPRNLSPISNAAKEKLKRQFSSSSINASSFLDTKVDNNQPEAVEESESDALPFLTTLSSQLPPILPTIFSPSQYTNLSFIAAAAAASSSSFLPYNNNNTIASQQIPVSFTEPFSLPPLSSLLTPSVDEGENRLVLPQGFFPTLLPVVASGSQQIPPFTPLICDPIVHIPVIDMLCSSGGQGYIVSSAGPPPLHQNLAVDPNVEKGARETLRMLLSGGSAQSKPQLVGMFPGGLTEKTDKRQSVVGLGNRGHYNTGVEDINIISSRISALGLVSSLSLSDQAVCFGKRWNGSGSNHEYDRVSEMSVPAYMEKEEERSENGSGLEEDTA